MIERELPGTVCNNYTVHGYYKLVIISDAYASLIFAQRGLSVAIYATGRDGLKSCIGCMTCH